MASTEVVVVDQRSRVGYTSGRSQSAAIDSVSESDISTVGREHQRVAVAPMASGRSCWDEREGKGLGGGLMIGRKREQESRKN